MSNVNRTSICALALSLVLGTLTLTGCGSNGHSQTIGEATTEAEALYLAARKAEAAAIPNAPTALPVSKKGFTELPYMVQLGEKLIRETNTHPLTAAYIPASDLTCQSCHRDGGKKKAIGSTFIGAAAAFPAFNERDGGVITLQDRINSCFMRSMNGTRLPENSEALLAMESYITWLSEGFPIKMNADRAVSKLNDAFVNREIQLMAQNGSFDKVAGEALYLSACASCHGQDGLGVDTNMDGHFENPPVWGPKSYNKGAGLANNAQGGSWIQFNMPPGQEFTLGNQDALNIAAYINAQTRPVFDENAHLPSGGQNYNGPEIVYHYGRYFTAGERAARVPAEPAPVITEPTNNGATLYADNCADCHGTLANSTKKGRTAAQIQSAIDGLSSMNSLKFLTADQVQAIATALAQ